jgi:hypothetical protein
MPDGRLLAQLYAFYSGAYFSSTSSWFKARRSTTYSNSPRFRAEVTARSLIEQAEFPLQKAVEFNQTKGRHSWDICWFRIRVSRVNREPPTWPTCRQRHLGLCQTRRRRDAMTLTLDMRAIADQKIRGMQVAFDSTEDLGWTIAFKRHVALRLGFIQGRGESCR